MTDIPNKHEYDFKYLNIISNKIFLLRRFIISIQTWNREFEVWGEFSSEIMVPAYKPSIFFFQVHFVSNHDFNFQIAFFNFNLLFFPSSFNYIMFKHQLAFYLGL